MDSVAAGDTSRMNKAPAGECAECKRLLAELTAARRERDILQKLVDERQMADARGKTPAELAIAALKDIAQGGAR